MNITLDSYLTRLSWSPEQFGNHLNEFARCMRLPDEIHPKTPRRWLKARTPSVLTCVPRQPWPGLVCALLSRRLHEPITLASLGWQTSAGALYDLERVADARRRLDDALGGGTVFRAVREDLRLVTETLDNASYTEQVGQRLYAVAAEFARLAGLLAYDNNHEALAQRYFLAGLRAAHSSGDRAVGANILGFMSKQARDQCR